jgi:hypothetical protein
MWESVLVSFFALFAGELGLATAVQCKDMGMEPTWLE